MTRQRGGLVIEVAAILGVMICVALMGAYLARSMDANSCEARWKDSGLKAEYRSGAGCMVQKPDGRWLPASAIREAGN